MAASSASERRELDVVAGVHRTPACVCPDVSATHHRLCIGADQRERVRVRCIAGPALAPHGAAYMLAWIFLMGGILDRYARGRRLGAHGFFAASGVFCSGFCAWR